MKFLKSFILSFCLIAVGSSAVSFFLRLSEPLPNIKSVSFDYYTLTDQYFLVVDFNEFPYIPILTRHQMTIPISNPHFESELISQITTKEFIKKLRKAERKKK